MRYRYVLLDLLINPLSPKSDKLFLKRVIRFSLFHGLLLGSSILLRTFCFPLFYTSCVEKKGLHRRLEKTN